MFCKICGNEVNDEAIVCVHCGCELDNGKNKENNNSKTCLGVVMAIFLGVIGLIIGICLYSSGTIARKTFVKGWIWTFAIGFSVALIIFFIALGISIDSSYYSRYY